MTGSGWSTPLCNPCAPNCMSIAGAGALPLEGEGVLFYLKFHISTNAKPCMCCDLWFTDITLYDPENPAPRLLAGWFGLYRVVRRGRLHQLLEVLPGRLRRL